MRARTFLTYAKDQAQCLGKFCAESKIRDFYSQEFKESLLPKLFEGWSRDDDYTIEHECGALLREAFTNEKDLGTTIIFSIDSDMVIESGYVSYSEDGSEYDVRKTSYPIMPFTLDQFISDCERACLNLTWKKEVVEEIFKTQ